MFINWFTGLGLAAKIGIGATAVALGAVGAGAAHALPPAIQTTFDEVVETVVPVPTEDEVTTDDTVVDETTGTDEVAGADLDGTDGLDFDADVEREVAELLGEVDPPAADQPGH